MRLRRLVKKCFGPVRVRLHLYALREVWKQMMYQAVNADKDPRGYSYRNYSSQQAWAQVRIVERAIRRTKRLLI